MPVFGGGGLKPFTQTLLLCVLVAILAALPGTFLILYGYEDVVRYNWIWIVAVTLVAHRAVLSILLALHSAWLQYRQVPHAFDTPGGKLRPVLDAAVCVVICVVAWAGAAQVRRHHFYEICGRVDGVLSALDTYRTAHGAYPERLEQLPRWAALVADSGVTIRQGTVTREGLCDVGHLNEVQATIYLLPNNKYVCCVPIEHVLTVSYARPGVYFRGSSTPRWKEIPIIWKYQGVDLDKVN